mmetsp:Transcript_3298/g.6870  ORF Transcript_3298/g.6870 Transcript_3298/m.6870 type:complete len:281 (+) Transcript_3298:2899-3741(+)
MHEFVKICQPIFGCEPVISDWIVTCVYWELPHQIVTSQINTCDIPVLAGDTKPLTVICIGHPSIFVSPIIATKSGVHSLKTFLFVFMSVRLQPFVLKLMASIIEFPLDIHCLWFHVLEFLEITITSWAVQIVERVFTGSILIITTTVFCRIVTSNDVSAFVLAHEYPKVTLALVVQSYSFKVSIWHSQYFDFVCSIADKRGCFVAGHHFTLFQGSQTALFQILPRRILAITAIISCNSHPPVMYDATTRRTPSIFIFFIIIAAITICILPVWCVYTCVDR